MPSAERGFLIDRAVYWEKYGVDKHGRVTLSDPVEIKCQVNKTNKIVSDAQGKPVSVVVQLVADRAIPEGGMIWLGRLREITGTSQVPESDLLEIFQYSPADDIKGRRTRYEASLVRFNDRLPTVVG